MTDFNARMLSPYDANGIKVRNRIAVAPMTRISAAEDGHATQTMFDYYTRFAKGGFGLITTEGIYTDNAFSQGYRFQPGLADDEQAHVEESGSRARARLRGRRHCWRAHPGVHEKLAPKRTVRARPASARRVAGSGRAGGRDQGATSSRPN